MTHWTDTFTTRLSSRHARGRPIRPEIRSAAPGLRGVVVRLIGLLLLWQERLLRDIGISRLDALQEAAKPFWRP